MADYTELIKELRYCVDGDKECAGCKRWGQMACDVYLMEEAADAIEVLSKYANTIRRLKCEGWYLQQNKYHDGYQAVATMPLPEQPKEEDE